MIRANASNPRGLPETELFRVDQDPNERVNLAEEQPAELAITSRRLDERQSQAGKGAVHRKSIDAEADPNAAHRLRALGYAGGE